MLLPMIAAAHTGATKLTSGKGDATRWREVSGKHTIHRSTDRGDGVWKDEETVSECNRRFHPVISRLALSTRRLRESNEPGSSRHHRADDLASSLRFTNEGNAFDGCLTLPGFEPVMQVMTK